MCVVSELIWTSDLEHSNQYVVGLALCTLGNIASTEMARDLFQEVENLLSTANPYIRRKAAICAMRIIRKVPDLQEHFIDKTKLLLQDRNHGVLLCGVTLVTDLCLHDPDMVHEFRPFTNALVRHLRSLTTSGYAPEHDVTGITDPFLQVKILRLLRVLGKGDAQVSEQINDILAEVATKTDSSKNVGNSILYESVLTILDIEADSGLRVLGVNILGKFLTNKDNNIRYVALNTLIKVVAVEPNAVQRHRNTILDCLRDPDISIRRRALDLSFTLINESNIRVLIRELLAFLEVSNNEFKPVLTTQICIAAERFAPTKRWHIDTVLRVLKLAGNYVKEHILSSFIRLIANSAELQTYCVQKLFSALKADITQEALTLAGAWTIGEYGDLLLKGGNYEEEELVVKVQESDVVDILATILSSAYSSQTINEYIITALMKLTTRISSAAQIERIRRILQSYTDSLDVEIQQRSVEYGNMFGYDDIRTGVLEKMPPPVFKEVSRQFEQVPKPKIVGKRGAKKQTDEERNLLDLIGDDPISTGPPANGSSNMDILRDILGDDVGTSSSPPPQAQSNLSSIMDLFNTPSPSAPPQQPAAMPAAMPFANLAISAGPTVPSGPAQLAVYNKNNLVITLQLQRTADGTVNIVARFKNNGFTESISGVTLQAAVPKSQKLQLQPISTAELGPDGEATQAMRVQGSKGVSFYPPNPRLS